MNHPAEMGLHVLLQNIAAGRGEVSEEVLDQVAADVKAALKKQIQGQKRSGNFSLRMSNIGKPRCQLWFEKNRGDIATPMQPFFTMQMLIGDVTEAVFKGLMRAAGIDFGDTDTVVLRIADTEIKGSYDMLLDGAVDDVKSASPWSYANKFDTFEHLAESDSFGYVAQLVGYAKAANKEVGGWWVLNKSNGEFKYLKADVDQAKVLAEIEKTVRYINEDKPFERCFVAEAETFYGKDTGNMVLPDSCHFCSFKKACWPELQELPKLVTRASTKNGAMTEYVYVDPKYNKKDTTV